MPPNVARNAFQIIAHRGVRTDGDFQNMAPENTLPAFQYAALHNAAIELDVLLTADGQVVVHHDVETGRIFSLPGNQKPVSTCALAELQSASLNTAGHEASVRTMLGADVAYHTPQPFRDVTIPTLEAVLTALPHTHIYIELKPTALHGLEATVSRLIREKDAYHRVTVIGFSARSLRAVKKQDPRIQTGLNVKVPPWLRPVSRAFPWLAPLYAKAWAKAASLQPSYNDATPALIAAAHRVGLPVIPWVDRHTRQQEQALFPTLLDMGVDGLITNSVDLLRQAVKNTKDS